MKPKENKDLTPAEIEQFGKELDAIRDEALQSLGQEDVDYIKGVIKLCRDSELAGRAMLTMGWSPLFWMGGTGLLAFSKIIENMEIGHNIMHGQYDFAEDPELTSQTYEWDTACPADQWRHSHNYMHHTFTNVAGVDRDLGYGLMRLSDDQPWEKKHSLQMGSNLLLSLFFQWGVALHDLEFDRLMSGEKELKLDEVLPILKKSIAQIGKDYVLFPLLSGPSAVPVALGNMTANLIRNVWAHAIIFCGHFTENAEVFEKESLENETRGEWYLRQLKGSSNLEGNDFFHLLSGNLSHQIEHHLFPDIPAWRYKEISKKVKALCEKYGQYYNTGSFFSQYLQVLTRIARYSLPEEATLEVNQAQELATVA